MLNGGNSLQQPFQYSSPVSVGYACPSPEILQEIGLRTDANELVNLAVEAANQAETILATLDSQHNGMSGIAGQSKGAKEPTVRDLLSNAIDRLRFATSRLGRVVYVVQS